MLPLSPVRRPSAAMCALALLAAMPGGAASQQDRVALEVAHDASSVVAIAYRAGALGFLAHDHAILAGDWDARLCMRPGQPFSAIGGVVIRVAGFEIDSERARATAGLDEDGPDADTRGRLREKMLDARFLDATRHPAIRLAIDSVVPDRPAATVVGATRAAVHGVVSLRGVSRALTFPALVRSGPGGVSVGATVPLRQREFGIEPESIAGVVRVRDEVRVAIRLVARVTDRACAPD